MLNITIYKILGRNLHVKSYYFMTLAFYFFIVRRYFKVYKNFPLIIISVALTFLESQGQ